MMPESKAGEREKGDGRQETGDRKKQKIFVETTNWGVSSTTGVSTHNGRFYRGP
jgi:hypothetical protein